MSNHNTLLDNELLLAFRSGDRCAFEVIYDRYWLRLYYHARNMLGSDEEAKDVVQEVFTDLWAKATSKNTDLPLDVFLYTATRNKVLNLLKHLKVEAKYVDHAQAFLNGHVECSDAMTRQRELAKIIEEGISSMPVKMREIFELSRKNHKSYKEISTQLNISDKTVKKQISNALHILKVKLNYFLLLL